MKALILTALLPCLVLAAGEVPLSFHAVKPAAPVAGDGANVPEEPLQALATARSAKDWKAVVSSCDALLALPGTAAARRLGWTEARRDALEHLGRWEEALAASMDALAYPMSSNTVHGVRMRVIRYLKDRLGRPEDAVRLGVEILADDASAPDMRAEAALLVAPVACQTLKDAARAGDILLRADALPTSPKRRAEVRGRLVFHDTHHCRPQKADDIRALTLSIVTNAYFLPEDRVHNAQACLDWHRKLAAAQGKIAPVAAIRAFLAEGAASPRAAARVEGEILRNLREAGAAAADDALATATALYANTNAAASIRISAASYLASRKRADGDDAGADALLASCYAFPDAGVNETETIARAIGDSFILRDKPDDALAAYREALRHCDTPDMRRRIRRLTTDLYKTFFRYEEARACYLEDGNRAEAARISANLMDDLPAADRLYREILEDASASRADRLAAWRWFFVRDPALADRFFTGLLGTAAAHTNEIANALADMIARGDNSYSFMGDYPAVRRAYGFLERIHAATGRTWSFAVMQYAANAFCDARAFAAAAKICRDALAWEVTKDAAERYQLEMMADLLPRTGSEAALLAAVRAADAKFAGDLKPETRVARLERIGSTAVTGANEPLARALAAYRASLFVPAPKRTYVVHYSEAPITGLSAWDKIRPAPERQRMDRVYGGSMDFLVTDVATGNRGEGIGTEEAAKAAPVPSIEIACDAFGLHLRYEAPDDKAAQMAAGFLGGGSYESYIAAGENEPYYCLLVDVAPNASLGVFNTTYSTTGHRQITAEDRGLYKTETAFTDHSAVTYVMLSWNAFATLIPDNGTVWEFENLHWGRADKAAWNGTESIHGRSTWGRLVFDLPQKARIEILKRVIFAVRKEYIAAKGRGATGVVGLWSDPILGDPAFYAACVAPLVAKLDAYLPLVTVEMSDADVLKVAEEALPGWRDIGFTVARLRARYLADQLAQ